jgi:hypothetical protein
MNVLHFIQNSMKKSILKILQFTIFVKINIVIKNKQFIK